MTKVCFITPADHYNATARYRLYHLLPHIDSSKVSYFVLSPTQRQVIVFEKIDKYGISSLDIEFDSIDKFQSLGDKNNLYNFSIFIYRLIKSIRKCDIVYVVETFLSKIIVDFLSKMPIQTIYDFDDAFYAPRPNSSLDHERIKRQKYILKKFDLVIAGSPELEKYAKKFTNNVKILPTAIPKEPTNQAYTKVTNSENIVISWIGYPGNLVNLEHIISPLEKILDEFEGVELRIITSGIKEDMPFYQREDVKFSKWSLETALYNLADSDISIRPLLDIEHNRAKGGHTSVVQAMGLRLPVVVTPVGLLDDFISDTDNGLHASDNEDWYKNLSKLIINTSSREKIGRNAFKSIGSNRLWSRQRASDLMSIIKSGTSVALRE